MGKQVSSLYKSDYIDTMYVANLKALSEENREGHNLNEWFR